MRNCELSWWAGAPGSCMTSQSKEEYFYFLNQETLPPTVVIFVVVVVVVVVDSLIWHGVPFKWRWTSCVAVAVVSEYKTDPYSEGDACKTICCRGDLLESKPMPGGCYDTKVKPLPGYCWRFYALVLANAFLILHLGIKYIDNNWGLHLSIKLKDYIYRLHIQLKCRDYV